MGLRAYLDNGPGFDLAFPADSEYQQIIYTGIDNGTGEAWCEDFDSHEEYMKWLRHEPAVDAHGELHEV